MTTMKEVISLPAGMCQFINTSRGDWWTARHCWLLCARAGWWYFEPAAYMGGVEDWIVALL
ncbi:MAG: hypothetical protein J5654_07790 [Victivallales bacterium]|nr:hypothetical protein [Victivallales bacterium]